MLKIQLAKIYLCEGSRKIEIAFKDLKPGDVCIKEPPDTERSGKFIVLTKPKKHNGIYGCKSWQYYKGYKRSHVKRRFFPYSDQEICNRIAVMDTVCKKLKNEAIKLADEMNRKSQKQFVSGNIHWAFNGDASSTYFHIYVSRHPNCDILFNGPFHIIEQSLKNYKTKKKNAFQLRDLVKYCIFESVLDTAYKRGADQIRKAEDKRILKSLGKIGKK